MFNATLKRSFYIFLTATLIGLMGCSNPEEKRAEQIGAALQFSQDGAYERAIEILEALAIDYPNDPQILKLIGRTYSKDGDFTMAAFYLEQAQLQQPDDVELLYETYQALEAAGQPNGALLEKLSEVSVETMTSQLWLRLGQYRAENNRTESALEAYLKGVDPDKATPAPETASAIGQLFAQLDNRAQASYWFEIAADSDDPSAQTALFGLLELQLQRENWAAAETTIQRLDTQFPGAVEASRWKQASDQIQQWREAQNRIKARLAAQEAEASEAAAAEIAAAEADEAQAAEAAEGTVAGVTDDASGKALDIADLEAAEALAERPAQATDEEERTITFDPDISITAADPDLGVDVSFDEADMAPETTFSVETEDAPDTVESFQPEELWPAIRPTERTRTLEELLDEATVAERNRDFKTAIRKYWAAISVVNNRADVWNLLSRAYLVDGQLENAEIAALESVRLDPREVAYTLDFLRVAQRSRPPEDFLAQLETAYDRFPASPEITLSLARAHERISQNNRVARNLYLRFIDIAPNHPLRTEAEAAAARLR